MDFNFNFNIEISISKELQDIINLFMNENINGDIIDNSENFETLKNPNVILRKKGKKGKKGKKIIAENESFAEAFKRTDSKNSEKIENEPKMSIDDIKRNATRIITKYRNNGYKYSEIANKLNNKKIPTIRGGNWKDSTVWSFVAREKIIFKEAT